MSGKVIIVTGASAGIGFEVVRILCEGGHDVICACRDEEKTNRCIERIKKLTPSALLTYMHLDLSNLESVRQFVHNFHTTGKKLTVLINNAGIAFSDPKRQFSKDHFELTMATNHLGPFLLTNLLLPDLKRAASEGMDARIVVVASEMHNTEVAKKIKSGVKPMDIDNIFMSGEGNYFGVLAYKNSKLGNVLMTYELSRQLEGSGVKVNAMCPGFVPTTELMRSSGVFTKFFTRYVLHGMLRFAKITRTVQQAGAAVCSLALDDKYKDVSGKFFKDGIEVKTSDESMDEEKRKKLWELSARYTRLEGYEPLEAPPLDEEPPKKEERTLAAAQPANEEPTAAVEAVEEKPAEQQLKAHSATTALEEKHREEHKTHILTTTPGEKHAEQHKAQIEETPVEQHKAHIEEKHTEEQKTHTGTATGTTAHEAKHSEQQKAHVEEKHSEEDKTFITTVVDVPVGDEAEMSTKPIKEKHAELAEEKSEEKMVVEVEKQLVLKEKEELMVEETKEEDTEKNVIIVEEKNAGDTTGAELVISTTSENNEVVVQ